jgi:hypothetical protein
LEFADDLSVGKGRTEFGGVSPGVGEVVGGISPSAANGMKGLLNLFFCGKGIMTVEGGDEGDSKFPSLRASRG